MEKNVNQNQDLNDLDLEEGFDDALENLIYSMRVHAEFYGYPKLMQMLKEYVAAKDKDAYVDSIDLNVNPQLKEVLTFGPSASMLKMIFEWLSVLDVDFLSGTANLIKDEKTASLFEGMIYMGLSVSEEEEGEEGEEGEEEVIEE